MLERLVDSFLDYCSRDETRSKLEARFLKPAVGYLSERFQWIVYVLQAVAVVLVIQTIILFVLLIRDLSAAGRALPATAPAF
jgi:hypothetical protein